MSPRAGNRRSATEVRPASNIMEVQPKATLIDR